MNRDLWCAFVGAVLLPTVGLVVGFVSGSVWLALSVLIVGLIVLLWAALRAI